MYFTVSCICQVLGLISCVFSTSPHLCKLLLYLFQRVQTLMSVKCRTDAVSCVPTRWGVIPVIALRGTPCNQTASARQTVTPPTSSLPTNTLFRGCQSVQWMDHWEPRSSWHTACHRHWPLILTSGAVLTSVTLLSKRAVEQNSCMCIGILTLMLYRGRL